MHCFTLLSNLNIVDMPSFSFSGGGGRSAVQVEFGTDAVTAGGGAGGSNCQGTGCVAGGGGGGGGGIPNYGGGCISGSYFTTSGRSSRC